MAPSPGTSSRTTPSPSQERGAEGFWPSAPGRAHYGLKTAAGLDGGEERLSLHSLRHSFASMLATELDVPATTLAQLVGHADPGFTLKAYARDAREPATVAKDLLARAAGAGVAG
jgi:integrase